MQNLTGKFFIDGKDLWTIFGMFIESGTDDFLKYPSRKDSITHDWGDVNGIDIDTTRVFLNERTISLRIGMIVDSESDFQSKYEAFLAQMVLPGERRIEPKRLGEKVFYCIYKECVDFTTFTKIRDVNKIALKFTLQLIEPQPEISNDTVFIVDEDGRFLVT